MLGGDGVVNIGYINATGVDLGAVKVPGDLGAIDAGDAAPASGLKSLSVFSLGGLGLTTGAPDLSSDIIGAVGSLKVTSDVIEAKFGVSGGASAKIATVFVGASIIGGDTADSGEISAQGAIGKVFVGGSLLGGSGKFSGAMGADSFGSITVGRSLSGGAFVDATHDAMESGTIIANKTIGSVFVGGNITGSSGVQSGLIFAGDKLLNVSVTGTMSGGDGSQSGEILATNMLGKVRVAGSVFGGNGQFSGVIGTTSATGLATSIFIGGDLIGGGGQNTGSVAVGKNVGTFTLGGSLFGGTQTGSGRISCGGTLAKGSIGVNVIGGSSDATNLLLDSGYILADRITSLTIGGSIISGVDGGGELGNSGAVRATHDIGTLTVKGNLDGQPSNRVVISAGGQQANLAPGAKADVAIKALNIGGNVNFAEVLAGYSPDVTPSARGTAVNPDAQIGTIKIGGNLAATSLVAGATPGTDFNFGDSNDAAIALNHRAGLHSKIASLIIGGQAFGTPVAGDSFYAGIVAQEIGSVKIGDGISIPIPAAGNLRALGFSQGTSLADGFDFHLVKIV